MKVQDTRDFSGTLCGIGRESRLRPTGGSFGTRAAQSIFASAGGLVCPRGGHHGGLHRSGGGDRTVKRAGGARE